MADEDLIVLRASAWRLVTDGVMGGVSEGTLTLSSRDDRSCSRLQGQVSTANNGGFIQMAQDLSAQDAAQLTAFAGVRVVLHGNDEPYNLHLRTADLSLPWQSYRVSVEAAARWQTLNIPFTDFSAYKTDATLRPERLRRLGLVAIGREFHADVCVAEAGFYRLLP